MKSSPSTFVLALVMTLFFFSSNAIAVEKSQSKCLKVGSIKTDSNFRYECKIVSNKKQWVPVKPSINTPAITNPDKVDMPSLTFGPLLWSDEFTGKSGTDLDPTSWGSNLGNYSNTAITINDPSLSRLDGSPQGILNIKTKKINDPSHYNGFCARGKFCQFKSGRISSRNRLNVQYGYIEARIKMPTGQGNWPAFWMLRDGNYDPKVLTPGEIDIIEWYGRYPTKSWSTLHFLPDPTDTKAATSAGTVAEYAQPLSNDFHTYAMAWLPNSITFLLDGVPVKTFTSDEIKTWPFNNFFFFILSGGVGPQPNTIFGGTWDGWQESTMSVDWLRVWQLNGKGQVVKETVPKMTPEEMLAQLK
jgi:beta-glucanase (GH16 family)